MKDSTARLLTVGGRKGATKVNRKFDVDVTSTSRIVLDGIRGAGSRAQGLRALMKRRE